VEVSREVSLTDDLNNLKNGAHLVIKFTHKSVVNVGLGVPSGGLSLVIFISLGKVSSSLLSEVSLLNNLVFSSGPGLGVLSDSSVSLVESGLADTHEVGMGGDGVFLILMSVSKGLVALVKDVLEHSEDSLDGTLVGEVLGEFEHDSDHLGPLGSVGEVLLELLDVILSSSDLYE